jgi:hypothetical protein
VHVVGGVGGGGGGKDIVVGLYFWIFLQNAFLRECNYFYPLGLNQRNGMRIPAWRRQRKSEMGMDR